MVENILYETFRSKKFLFVKIIKIIKLLFPNNINTLNHFRTKRIKNNRDKQCNKNCA